MAASTRTRGRDSTSRTASRRAPAPRGTLRPPTHPDLPPIETPVAERAAVVLWIVLAALVAARGALTFAPGMWAWSLNLQRFIDPGAGWVLWAASALALAPPVARRIEPLFARAGDAAINRPAAAFVAWAVGAVLLTWMLPDHVHYVGDFLLRQRTLAVPPSQIGQWYPQALSLDLFVHDSLARAAMATLGLDAMTFARGLGAIEAAALAAIAVAYARALRLGGTAGFAVTAILFFGGYLTMFTGYNKAFSEMCLVVPAVGLAATRVARQGRGLLALGVSLSIGLFLHRSVLVVLPACIAAYVLYFPTQRQAAWKRPATLVALAIPLASLVIAIPRIVSIIRRVDSMHLVPEEVQRQGWWFATFEPSRATDMLNLVIMMSPMFIAVPFLLVFCRRWIPAGRASLPIGLLAAAGLGSIVIIHPAQGMFRDWDDLAAAGVALSFAAAWLVGETLRAAPRLAWLGVAVGIGSALPATQWLLQQNDLERGLARAHALASEPPVRAPWPTTSTWEYIGMRNAAAGRSEESARAYRVAASRLPSPNILRQLAASEAQAGHLDSARIIYRTMLSRNPNDAIAWRGLGIASFRLGDYVEARRAAREVLRFDPSNADARAALDSMDRQAPAAKTGAGSRDRQAPAGRARPDSAGARR